MYLFRIVFKLSTLLQDVFIIVIYQQESLHWNYCYFQNWHASFIRSIRANKGGL